MKRTNPIPEVKKKAVKELLELIEKNKTILVASMRGIPASQFQEICKKLRGTAVVKVLKKNLIFRALDSAKSDVNKLKEQITDSFALLFSNTELFNLASELNMIKTPAKAKPGQEAPEDIEIEAGPTELVPGPAVSELGALGIQIQIEKGKIHIKDTRIIAKKGEKISEGVAALMSKLDIKPFEIGLTPLAGFDTEEGKLYLDIKIDKEGTVEKLKSAHGKVLPFAVEIGYPVKDTVGFLIGKAHRHGHALEKLKPVEEEKVEEKKEESAEQSEVAVEEKKEKNTPEDKTEGKEK